METITGEVSGINLNKIKLLFPHLSHAQCRKLARMNHVDVLIGMQHPSWHPDRAEKAKGAGELYVYRGDFGDCIGGCHPDIVDQTQKSDSLFTVVHSYHQVEVKDRQPAGYSHHLEFCPSRVQNYYISGSGSNVPHCETPSPTASFEVIEQDSSTASEVEPHTSTTALSEVIKPRSLALSSTTTTTSLQVTEPHLLNATSMVLEPRLPTAVSDLVESLSTVASEGIEPRSTTAAASEVIEPYLSSVASEVIEPGTLTPASGVIEPHLSSTLNATSKVFKPRISTTVLEVVNPHSPKLCQISSSHYRRSHQRCWNLAQQQLLCQR